MNYNLIIKIIRLARKISGEVSKRRQNLQFIVIGISFLLGLWGWNEQIKPTSVSDYFNNLFRTFQLVTLNFPSDVEGNISWQLQVARFLLPSVAVLATIDTVVGSITRPVRLFFLARAKNHIIICGDDQLATSALQTLSLRGVQIGIIDPSISEARKEYLESVGLTVLAEDPMDLNFFSKVNLSQSSAIFMIMKNDASNMNLAIEAIRRIKDRAKSQAPLTIGVQINDDKLASELDFCLDNLSKVNNSKYHRICPDRDGLRLELSHYAPIFTKLDKKEASHVLIVGLTSNWRQSLMQLIISCQDNPFKNPFFTFIVTKNEEEILKQFKNALPELDLVAEFRFIRSSENNFLEFDHIKPDTTLPSINLVVILKNDAEAIASALALRSPKNPFHLKNEPILVFREVEDCLLQQLQIMNAPDRNLKDIVAFGGVIRKETIETALDYSEDTIAISLHESYQNKAALSSEITQASLTEWYSLAENLRDANRVAANHMPILLAYLGLKISNSRGEHLVLSDRDLEFLARIEHKRWIADRLDRGYRYNKDRDDARRYRPNIIPYDELPEEEKQKDRDNIGMFIKIIEDNGRSLSTS